MRSTNNAENDGNEDVADSALYVVGVVAVMGAILIAVTLIALTLLPTTVPCYLNDAQLELVKQTAHLLTAYDERTLSGCMASINNNQ